MNKPELETPDGMPREVATTMILDPKTKLSNRMLKNCRAARARYFMSKAPMTRDGEGGYNYVNTTERDDEDMARDRLKKATWTQLVKWYSRVVRRLPRQLAKYQAMPEHVQGLPAAILMRALIARMSAFHDALTEELNARTKLANRGV